MRADAPAFEPGKNAVWSTKTEYIDRKTEYIDRKTEYIDRNNRHYIQRKVPYTRTSPVLRNINAAEIAARRQFLPNPPPPPPIDSRRRHRNQFIKSDKNNLDGIHIDYNDILLSSDICNDIQCSGEINDDIIYDVWDSLPPVDETTPILHLPYDLTNNNKNIDNNMNIIDILKNVLYDTNYSLRVVPKNMRNNVWNNIIELYNKDSIICNNIEYNNNTNNWDNIIYDKCYYNNEKVIIKCIMKTMSGHLSLLLHGLMNIINSEYYVIMKSWYCINSKYYIVLSHNNGNLVSNDMESVLKRHKSSNNYLKLSNIINIIINIIDGVKLLNKTLLSDEYIDLYSRRNLDSRSVYLLDSSRACLTDWGLSEIGPATTLHYTTAPEEATRLHYSADSPSEEAVDVFGISTIMWELLTHTPYIWSSTSEDIKISSELCREGLLSESMRRYKYNWARPPLDDTVLIPPIYVRRALPVTHDFIERLINIIEISWHSLPHNRPKLYDNDNSLYKKLLLLQNELPKIIDKQLYWTSINCCLMDINILNEFYKLCLNKIYDNNINNFEELIYTEIINKQNDRLCTSVLSTGSTVTSSVFSSTNTYINNNIWNLILISKNNNNIKGLIIFFKSLICDKNNIIPLLIEQICPGMSHVCTMMLHTHYPHMRLELAEYMD
eukprot:GHVL01006529.1.p1 GENE.GHVL01006529.1~~GHVL01006529.1.p1  ORF type:complete len:665 (+),score=206.17 GHVL01006529.1:188-2182(+)